MADTDDQKPPSSRKLEPGELSKMNVHGWWKLGLKPEKTLLDDEDADKEAHQILFGTIGDIVQMSVEEMLYAFSAAFSREISSSSGQPLRTGELRDMLDDVREHIPDIMCKVMYRLEHGECPYSESDTEARSES